jgi:hypothetical protein
MTNESITYRGNCVLTSLPDAERIGRYVESGLTAYSVDEIRGAYDAVYAASTAFDAAVDAIYARFNLASFDPLDHFVLKNSADEQRAAAYTAVFDAINALPDATAHKRKTKEFFPVAKWLAAVPKIKRLTAKLEALTGETK